MIYYLYRLENSLKFDKCGVTINWNIRFKDNKRSHGNQCVITELETMEGPNTPEFWQVVGDKEWELANQYGYPRGIHYRDTRIHSLLSNTPAACVKMSAAATGRVKSEETRRKLSIANKGRVPSKETRRKLSIALKGTTRKALRSLTFEIAEEIRAKYIPRKYTIQTLADEYGVAHRAIFQIIKNITYIKKGN